MTNSQETDDDRSGTVIGYYEVNESDPIEKVELTARNGDDSVKLLSFPAEPAKYEIRKVEHE